MVELETIPLSALQHYLYCPRQCALIHMEQQWLENEHTAAGRLLHERVDESSSSKRGDVRTVTSMALNHPALGIVGVADVIEFHRSDTGIEHPRPIEYKRGGPKAHSADEVQLCAQGLCLEQMFGIEVCSGALFYGKTRRRKDVEFDQGLRRITVDTIGAVRAMLDSGVTPLVGYDPRRCDACSLIDACEPRVTGRRRSVHQWLREELDTEPADSGVRNSN